MPAATTEKNLLQFTEEIADEFTADELKKLHQTLMSQKPPTKKLDLAENVASFLCGANLCGDNLGAIFDRVETLEKLAVGEDKFRKALHIIGYGTGSP